MFLIGAASQVDGFVFPEDSGPRMEAAVERFEAEALPGPGSHRIWFDRGTVDLDSVYGPTQDRLKAALLARATGKVGSSKPAFMRARAISRSGGRCAFPKC